MRNWFAVDFFFLDKTETTDKVRLNRL